MINVAIVGCGLIGKKRASALPNQIRLVSCYDLIPEVSAEFGKIFNCNSVSSLSDISSDKSIDFVIISVRHNDLAKIAIQMLLVNKSIFIEKPGALNSKELREVKEIALSRNLKAYVGFNHEFHPSFLKAQAIIESGTLGDLMFIRGRYGHGGRLGYEKEWRANKELSGGGELIDQGTHLISIALSLFSDLSVDYAATPNYFWKMPVEDNVFISLKDEKNRLAFLHASCTEWKNMFSLEIYGKQGKIDINGLGGSYGQESLTHFTMLPEMGPPLKETWVYDGPDMSWSFEIEEFVRDFSSQSSNLGKSIRVLEIVEEIYARTGR